MCDYLVIGDDLVCEEHGRLIWCCESSGKDVNSDRRCNAVDSEVAIASQKLGLI